MDYYVIPKRIRARIGKEGLAAILGVSKGTIQRNIIEPLQRIWGTSLVGDINSQNICPMFGEDVYCLGAEKVSQVSKIRGASLKYCYGDEVADWNQDVFNMLKSRLDKPYSCFDGACNPDAPQHWFKKFLDSDADIYCQKYEIFDNPFLSPEFVDELCKEYGLSVIKEKATKKKMNYDNFYKKSLYTDNYSNNAKRDLDLAIRQAYSYDDFLYLMKKLDYEIIFRTNKISIRKEPYKRNIRIERRYGENYSIENIKRRILEEQSVRVPFIENVYNYRKVNYPFAKRHKRAKAKGFIALYYHYCYLLKVFPDNVPQQKLPPSIRADVSRMEQLSEEARFLATHKIKTFEELSNYQDDVSFKIKEILDQREKLWSRRKLSKDENEMHKYAEQISSLNDKLIKLRKRVELCEDIKTRVPKIDNNLSELDTQEEIEKETKDRKKDKSNKGKE